MSGGEYHRETPGPGQPGRSRIKSGEVIAFASGHEKTHDELLAAGEFYAELYRIQFARQSANSGTPTLPGEEQHENIQAVSRLTGTTR
jgi:hypothetical protein